MPQCFFVTFVGTRMHALKQRPEFTHATETRVISHLIAAAVAQAGTHAAHKPESPNAKTCGSTTNEGAASH